MAELIRISRITVPQDRQRQEFDEQELVELGNSISGPAGLLHPLVVVPVGEGYQLVAGERRLRAIKTLVDLGGTYTYNGTQVPADHVPCSILASGLPRDDLEEAELHENIKRKDLTWQEQVAATDRLHKLRLRQRGAEHTVAKTGAEVAKLPAGTTSPSATNAARTALVIAEHLLDKDVAGAASQKEALKVIERKARAKENALLAASVGEIKSPHTLLVGSCLSVEIPQANYSVLLTDPPYAMGADQFADGGGAVIADHAYKDDPAVFDQVVLPALARATLFCAPAAHAYVFCDHERFAALKVHMRSLGWNVFRTPLIWVKDNGRVPLPEHGPRRLYECILYAYRGGRKVNYIGGDVLTFPADKNLGMSAQKPVALYAELLARSVRPADWVLDPFCGTGPIFPAASKHACRAVGIEEVQSTAGIAAGRLQNG